MGSKVIKSFTLIEMLIVIVIIGILAAALVPRLQDVQGRARDSKRKVDLRTIYQANEIFKTDFGMYATAGNDSNYFSIWTTGGTWLVSLSGLLSSVPKDPINALGTRYVGAQAGPWHTGNYHYRYGNVKNNSQTYDLTALLENSSDPDRCEARQRIYDWPTANCLFISTGFYPGIRKSYEYSPDSGWF